MKTGLRNPFWLTNMHGIYKDIHHLIPYIILYGIGMMTRVCRFSLLVVSISCFLSHGLPLLSPLPPSTAPLNSCVKVKYVLDPDRSLTDECLIQIWIDWNVEGKMEKEEEEEKDKNPSLPHSRVLFFVAWLMCFAARGEFVHVRAARGAWSTHIEHIFRFMFIENASPSPYIVIDLKIDLCF